MSRPIKHPKTGIYQFRKAVPEALRSLVGKREEKFSLQTKDPHEAKRLFAIEAARVEREWATLRKPVEPLSHKQIVALSGVVYRETVGRYEDDPGRFLAWPGAFVLLDEDGVFNREPEALDRLALELFGPVVDDLLVREGVHADEVSRTRLCREVFVAAERVAKRLRDNLEGDYSPDDNSDRFPEWKRPADPPSVAEAWQVVTDMNVQPNHGWRHRFKTLCREAQIDRRVMDEMQGHAPENVSDAYGEVTIKAMAAALERFPRQGDGAVAFRAARDLGVPSRYADLPAFSSVYRI